MILIFAFTALVLLLLFVYLLARHTSLGLLSLLAVELYKYSIGAGQNVIGSLHLDPLDVISMCLIAAGVIRTLPRLKKLNTTHLIAFGFLLLFALSLFRGVISNGFFPVADECRGYAAVAIAILYFLDAPTDDKSVKQYVWMYIGFAVALCVIAVLATLGMPVGSYAYFRGSEEAYLVTTETGRYLPSAAAEIMAISAFLSLAIPRQTKWGLVIRQLPLLFFAAAIYLRHRSVWLTLLVGSVCLLPLHARLFRRLVPVTLLALAATAVLALYGADMEGVAGIDRFTESASNSDTWNWRVNGWLELLQGDDGNAATVLIGKSMGSGFWRVDPHSGQTVVVGAHNEYLAEYLRVGAIGLGLLLLLFVRPLVKMWKVTRVSPYAIYPSTSAWAIVLIMMLAYGISYSIDDTLYPLLGIAGALMERLRAREKELATVEEDWESDSMGAYATGEA